MLAIVFAPLYRRILRSIGQQPNLAALATLVTIVSATHPEGREEVSVFTPEVDMSGVEADVRYVP